MAYHTLDPERIIETIGLLAQRIEERFPGSSLAKVCRDLLEIARVAKQRAARIARRSWGLGCLTGLLALAIVGSTAGAFLFLRVPDKAVDVLEFTQFVEAATNEVVLIGAAIFFLVTLESRIKRRRALAAIHELRALVHVIDMHQLTKDPERNLGLYQDTASSPQQKMTPFLLNRYLDYCTEMLSLVGKIAALYVQDFDDPVALEAATDLETLATGLSRKIWQKIMVLHDLRPQ